MRVELHKAFTFEAAHRLPHVPADHKCARMHGHSFRLTVTVEGEVNAKLGWLQDYAEIAAAVDPLIQQLDHRALNDVAGLENPTSEMLCGWLWERLHPRLPLLAALKIDETCMSSCTYRGR